MSDYLNLSELEQLFEDVVSNVADGLAEGLHAFQSLVDAGTEHDSDIINDAAIVLLEELANQSSVNTAFLNKLFESWAETLGGIPEAFANLADRTFTLFSHHPDFFRAVMEAMIATVEAFPEFVVKLANHLIDQPAAVMRGVNRVLLPVVAVGAAVFGTEIAVDAIWSLLRDKGQQLGQTALPLDVGLDLPQVNDWVLQVLSSDAYELPLGTWVVALILDALRQAGDFVGLMANAPIANGLLDDALDPIVNAVAGMVTDYIADVETLTEALIAELISQGESDPDLEWLLIKVGRFTPVGLFMIVVAASIKLVTNPAPWLDMVLNEVERDDRYKVLRLPPPDEHTKYIVLSDIHRDEDGASKGRYQLGSIDHFLTNSDDYLALLRHLTSYDDGNLENKPTCNDMNYVIIEAGDCEEMWFHCDVSELSAATPPALMRKIINSHEDIYKLQRALHAKGRYHRIHGNHDGYLRQTETHSVLREFMEEGNGVDFEIYDFIIIEGVKTMHDLRVDLGLNSAPYSERLPLLITHGHQWDFWNCDSNSILGKLVVTAVVTPLDKIDDPMRDLAGISFAGTPLINFKQEIGDLPIFDSWQNYEPAVRRLDHIQHMEDKDRVFTDDILYSESLASLMGLLIRVDPGSVAAADPPNPLPDGVSLPPWSSMCIGHTHNPHNMPYYDLDDLPLPKSIKEKLDAAVSSVLGPIDDLVERKIRSYYINTGVCGWYDNCFWALDLGKEGKCDGQPKLVNWTWNTRLDRPNHMDWELPHVSENDLPGLSSGDVVATLAPWLEKGVLKASEN